MSMAMSPRKKVHGIDDLGMDILVKLTGAYAESMSTSELGKLLNASEFRVSSRLYKLRVLGLIEGEKSFRLTDVGSRYVYSKLRRDDLSDAKSDPE